MTSFKRKYFARKVKTRSRPIQAAPDPEDGKLALRQCRDILCREGAVYTDEQVATIRKVLYALAAVDYRYHIQHKHPARLNVSSDKNPSTYHEHQQESDPVLPRLYGRAG